jgi:RepB DNA-primase N-terminal domain
VKAVGELRHRRGRSHAAAPPQEVVMRLADGHRRSGRLGAFEHAALLSALLHEGCPGLVELVGARRFADGRLGRFERSSGRNFLAAGDRAALAERLAELAAGHRREVFFTPATLRIARAGNSSVASSAVAWVDIDDPLRLQTLRAFPHRPHAVVASGSGGAHAYWRLAEPLAGEACEELNRRLAGALGADLASTNRGRIMRVPGTLNYKHAGAGEPGVWCRVVACDLARPGYRAAQLGAGLPDPRPTTAPRPARAPPPGRGEEPWRRMEPADYYRAITGTEPGRDGKVRCPNPAHEDRHPSAHLYAGPGAGWYCFACGAGGGAVDLVAALRGAPTGRALRGEQFAECVAELRRIFGVPEPPARRGGAQ